MRQERLCDGGGRERVARLWVAESAWERTRGLLGRVRLAPDEAMWLPRCRAVHTWFMRFAIDAVFVDADGRVARVAAGLGPWRVAWSREAVHTLEMPAGGARRSGLAAGVLLRLPD